MLDKHFVPANFGIMPTIHFLGLQISTYSLFLALALIAAFICFKLTATPLSPVNREHRSLIITFALLGGIVGAKLPIMLYNYDMLFQYPENLQLLLSGKTIVGGLIGGFLTVFFLKRHLHLQIKTGNDVAAPVALGMAIGRLGCFFRGCCYGIPSPKWMGIDFGDGVFRYPTQIYEMIFDFGLFCVLLYLKKKGHPAPGALFRYLLNAYLIFRFFLEFIRESDIALWGLSYYQIICLLCVVAVNRKLLMKFGKNIGNILFRKGELE
jgi:phosphatidylglycerol---prolipoprotein diacylglyceryl transferase